MPSPFLPSNLKQVMEGHLPSLFQPSLFQLNHHKQGFANTTSKISDSLIESEVLPYVPDCGFKFHANAVHLHLAFIAPSQSEAYLEPRRTSAREVFWQRLNYFYNFFFKFFNRSLFLQKSSIIDVQQGTRYATTQ